MRKFLEHLEKLQIESSVYCQANIDIAKKNTSAQYTAHSFDLILIISEAWIVTKEMLLICWQIKNEIVCDF